MTDRVILPKAENGKPYSATIKIEAGDAPFTITKDSLPVGYSAFVIPYSSSGTGFGIRITGPAATPAPTVYSTLTIASAGGCFTDLSLTITGLVPCEPVQILG